MKTYSQHQAEHAEELRQIRQAAQRAIERCNAEIATLQAQPADIPDRAYLVTMGMEDWKAEKRILEGACE